MGYVGNEPTSNFASVTKDSFSGDGSTTAFTLSKASTTNGVAVFVENVRQEPTIAYAVSGTTLTFTAAPVSASGNNIYVLHHNAVASTANHPAAQDLTAVNGTFTGAFTSLGIDDNANATSITIDSDENVGIGTTSPDGALHVKGISDHGRIVLESGGTSGSNNNMFMQFHNHGGTEIAQIAIEEGASNEGQLIFKTGGTTTAMTIDKDGHITKPLQPAFSVTANQQNDIPINGATTLEFANEIFDQNADFNTGTYTFTAPVTGKYMLNVNLRMDNVDRDHVYLYMILKTSNREYEWLQDISVLYGDDPDYLPFTINVLADMDASDTAYVRMHIPNLGAAISDVVGSSKSTFSGYLAC